MALCTVSRGESFYHYRNPEVLYAATADTNDAKTWYNHTKTTWSNKVVDGKSEYQSWGMILSVCHNDRPTFDKVWGYVKSQMATNSRGMYPWKGCCNAGNVIDGDVDIAIALDMAAERWPNQGYDAHAKDYMDKIYTHMRPFSKNSQELNALSGKCHNSPCLCITHYDPLGYLVNFASRTGNQNWIKEVNGVPGVMEDTGRLWNALLSEPKNFWPPHYVYGIESKLGQAYQKPLNPNEAPWHQFGWGQQRQFLRAAHAWFNYNNQTGYRFMKEVVDRQIKLSGSTVFSSPTKSIWYGTFKCDQETPPSRNHLYDANVGSWAVACMAAHQKQLDELYEQTKNWPISASSRGKLCIAYALTIATGMMDLSYGGESIVSSKNDHLVSTPSRTVAHTGKREKLLHLPALKSSNTAAPGLDYLLNGSRAGKMVPHGIIVRQVF